MQEKTDRYLHLPHEYPIDFTERIDLLVLPYQNTTDWVA